MLERNDGGIRRSDGGLGSSILDLELRFASSNSGAEEAVAILALEEGLVIAPVERDEQRRYFAGGIFVRSVLSGFAAYADGFGVHTSSEEDGLSGPITLPKLDSLIGGVDAEGPAFTGRADGIAGR